jgi:hypothetical protein
MCPAVRLTKASTQAMRARRVDSARLSPATRWMALICLLLVGTALVVSALHLHPNDLGSDAKHCSVCQVAHAPMQAVSPAHIVFGLTASAFLAVSAQPRSRTFLTTFSLFSRPPPPLV